MMNNQIARTQLFRGSARGFTLIEVLVGIVVFALGMMALAQLQTNLARNSSDANARTVAVNIAEETVESVRSFSTNADYQNIVSGESTVPRGNYNYTVAMDVTDYYYINDSGTGSFSTTAPSGAASSDAKLLELTVTWDSDPDNTQLGQLGSGSIELTEIISSITSSGGGKVAVSQDGDGFYAPPVNYNPGANPDIISIQLGANKFKESTTPLPDVVRADELVETRFDVVTYSQDNSGATFLRREEFRAVSCECTLRAADSDGEGGYRPSVWNGNEYSDPEWVAKPWGESANNQQSAFCDMCCRDHHDGGTGENDVGGDPGLAQFDPFRPDAYYHDRDAFRGDHKHFSRNLDGVLEVADSDGDSYVEACRMIRKDGFWRIAQDLRQEGLNAFPSNYLDDPTEVSAYSSYVTGAVTDYEIEMAARNEYEESPPGLTQPHDMSPAVIFPASTRATQTIMGAGIGVGVGSSEQQLRSRGIYIDYMSDELRTRINCLDLGGSGESCDVPDVTSALEIIPFYDVQLTWLSRWTETPTAIPIEVTNQAIADNNSHTRGYASVTSGDAKEVNIFSAVHTGNLGLTGTDPIDPAYISNLEDYLLYAHAGTPVDDPDPPTETGILIAGIITSSVTGVKAADVEIEASDAVCDRSNTGFECYVAIGATNPRIEVNNYFKRTKNLYACSPILVIHGQEHSGDNLSQNWTRFYLPGSRTINANIIIQEGPC